MFEIKTLNKIAPVGLNRLDRANFSVDTDAEPQGILVRSASMHEMELPASLLAIARAGAGVNNIPLDKCTEAGVCVFNTPGANANAVKELAVAALLLASRDIAAGIDWCRGLTGDDVDKQVEKGKSQFVGPELLGKTLGVIGLGAIGGLVANVAVNLGMNVLGCDPYLSVNNALHLSRAVSVVDQKTLLAQCDYLTIHSPLTDSTRNMICSETLAQMKPGVRIINLSRGGLVNDDDILAALESGQTKELEGFRLLSGHDFSITLKEPFAAFLACLSMPGASMAPPIRASACRAHIPAPAFSPQGMRPAAPGPWWKRWPTASGWRKRCMNICRACPCR